MTGSDHKQCTACHIVKHVDEFYKNRRGKYGVTGMCKLCCGQASRNRYHNTYKDDPQYKAQRKDYAHHYHILNRESENKRVAARDRLIRLKCLNHYGNQCACCGENRPEFLAIDHINGGGSKHRQTIGGKIYRWLVNNKYPVGFRVLCHNCNMSIGLYGYCPHKTIPISPPDHVAIIRSQGAL